MKTIFHNANVVTMDAARPRAEAVAVENGRITALGSDTDVLALKSGASLVDCRGGALLPGFVDAHLHLLAYAASLISVDCSPDAIASIADIQHALRRRAAQTPAGRWVRATGYDETALAERRHPTRWDLDTAVPDHPVRLIHRSGHASVLNSLALALAGVGIATEEPVGGYMHRDLTTGEPTGLLVEMDALLDAAIPRIDDVELARAVRQASDNLLSEGVTAVQDATSTNGPDEWQTFRRLVAEGHLRLPVTVFEGYASLGKLPQQALGGRLRRGAVKIALSELGGEITPSEDELADMVWQAHRRGRQVAIHAIGRRAVEAAVRAIEEALRRKPRRDHRHRIEHCGVCPPDLAQRIGALGIAVVSQPSFLYHSGERYLAQVPREDLPHLYPFGDLLRAGALLAAGSDAPVVPPRPLLSIQTAVTRAGRLGAVLSPQQSLDVAQALLMHTRDAAWSVFQDDERGSIEPGKRADFVLLSNDPTAVPPDEIADLDVEMTVIAGEIAWPPSAHRTA
jgi:predicted amidohydrolase YtcJ